MQPNKLRRAFTKWYIKRGYRFGYEFDGRLDYENEVFKFPVGMPKSVFECPWWVKPLLIFFSPSTYFAEYWGKNIIKWFEEGIHMGMNDSIVAKKSTDEKGMRKDD